MEDDLDLGPCCCCGKSKKNVRNIVMLNKKAPIPGTGWGCVVCGLPADGASYVCCDDCLKEGKEPKWAISGWPKDGGRILIGELEGEHEHDMKGHAEWDESHVV